MSSRTDFVAGLLASAAGELDYVGRIPTPQGCHLRDRTLLTPVPRSQLCAGRWALRRQA